MTSLIPQRPPAVSDFVGRGCAISEAPYASAAVCARDIALSYVSVKNCRSATAGSIVLDVDVDVVVDLEFE